MTCRPTFTDAFILKFDSEFILSILILIIIIFIFLTMGFLVCVSAYWARIESPLRALWKYDRVWIFLRLFPLVCFWFLHGVFVLFWYRCKLVIDKHTGKSFGYGFVQYESFDSTQQAIKHLNGAQYAFNDYIFHFFRQLFYQYNIIL